MKPKINKKVVYAIRMYKFHTRLTNKYLKIIQEYLEKKELLDNNTKRKTEDIIEGQLSIFD